MKIGSIFGFVSDVDRVGKVRCVTNAKCIQDVGMVIAMEVLGNVYAIQTGVAFYVIKVSYIQRINCNRFNHILTMLLIPFSLVSYAFRWNHTLKSIYMNVHS